MAQIRAAHGQALWPQP